MDRTGTIQVFLPKRLLKHIERLVPRSLRGARKNRVRVEYAIEQYLAAEEARKAEVGRKAETLAKAS